MQKKLLIITSSWLQIGMLIMYQVLVPLQVHAAHGIAAFQQQINITNGEFSTTSLTDSPVGNELGLVSFDPAAYDGETVYFEALIKCDTCSGGNGEAAVSLYTKNGTSISTLSSSSGSYTLLRSGSLSLSADEYTVRFKLDAVSGTAYLKAARLIINQTEGGGNGIAATQTQVEIGHYEDTTSTTQVELTAPKYYQYDNAKFSGTKAAYFEATLRTTNSTSVATYYFDSYNAGEQWVTNPGNMVDVSAATYAASNLDGDSQLLDANSNTGTDLGTITKVELRVRAYQDNDASGSITIRPVFSGTQDGNNHGFTPAVGAGDWSAYIDITNDTNAPTSWTWTDVQNLDADVVWEQNVGSNTGFVGKVEIQVTYEDEGIAAYAELYNKTNSAIVATVQTSSETTTLVRSAQLAGNWDTSNPDQYVVRIYSSNAAHAAYISNAKIIISQTETGGVKKVEIPHQLVTTSRSQTNTSYTQDSFLEEYQPNAFDTPHTRKIYFDVTIKTSAGNGYAQLYNVTNADAIDTPTSSEIVTGSTSFEQLKTADLGDNSDWPTTTKAIDTIIKASSGNTVSIASSRILFEIANLEPTFTLSVAGVGAAQTHNGITTTVATTSTTVPFGSITPGVPAFAAQQLTVEVNDANTNYVINLKLEAQLQGLYPGNNIDPFSGNGATWNNPQNWLEPTGTTKNVNTGWFGANTTDTAVSGWSNAQSKFGPVSTSNEIIIQSNGENKSEYILFAIEANSAQPADQYSGTLVYSALPVY